MSLDLDATTVNLIPKNFLWKESQTAVTSLVHDNGFQNGFIKYSDLHYKTLVTCDEKVLGSGIVLNNNGFWPRMLTNTQ